ncbi:MAG: bacterioferritin [Gammaproteobacteria bacterium RIFCSPHIGHO2_12_FULL_38_14]|nr:MAG: bacterioferritin [Gammaproteobacteria bacterium RIFCSPHIGHO2_12_FULL_38_14]
MAFIEHDSLDYNLKQVKKDAKQSMKKGALTKDYPFNVNEACRLLNMALSTEIMCVLRYRHHQIIAKGIDRIQVSAEFKEHAEEEEKHMLMLAERINQLGGDPDFNPSHVIKNSATEYGASKHLKEMIEEDLIAERMVIGFYRKLIEWFGLGDPTTRIVLEEILKDEEEHANDLADLLATS